MAEIRNPQLAELARDIEAGIRHAERTAGGLSTAQLDWQFDPSKWGVGHCLEHLVLSAEHYEPEVPGKIAEARAKQEAQVYDRWKSGWMGGMLIKYTRPGTRPVRTSRKMDPIRFKARPDVLKVFVQKYSRMVEWIHAADGLDVSRVRIRSPFIFFITYHLGDAFTLNAVHIERHLLQADRVKERAGFPR